MHANGLSRGNGGDGIAAHRTALMGYLTRAPGHLVLALRAMRSDAPYAKIQPKKAKPEHPEVSRATARWLAGGMRGNAWGNAGEILPVL